MLRHFPCVNLHPNPTIERTEVNQHLQDVFFFHRLSTQCGFSKFLRAQAPPNSCGLDAGRTFYGARHPAAAAEWQDTGGVGRRQVGQQVFTHPCRNTAAFEQLAEHLRFCQPAEGQSGLWSMACASPPVYLVISFLGAFASSSSHLECLISSVFQSLTQNYLPRAPQQFICISPVTLGTFYL